MRNTTRSSKRVLNTQNLDQEIQRQLNIVASHDTQSVTITQPKTPTAPPVDPFSLLEFVARQPVMFAQAMTFEQFLDRVPRVNDALEAYREEFPRLRLTPLPDLDAKFKTDLQNLWKSLEKVPYYTRVQRIVDYYLEFWYCLLALNVDLGDESTWWTERLEVACCTVWLNWVSSCIRLLAGQWVEDRELFLMRLRPYHQKAVAALKEKELRLAASGGLQCGCQEDLK